MGRVLGFTGTSKQEPLTQVRRRGLQIWLQRAKEQLGFDEFHHGDCVGADEITHFYAASLGYRIIIHPPVDPKARAFCRIWERGVILEEAPYLVRNNDIVKACEVLVAMPKVVGKEERRSGTWATVRYARKAGKDVEFF